MKSLLALCGNIKTTLIVDVSSLTAHTCVPLKWQNYACTFPLSRSHVEGRRHWQFTISSTHLTLRNHEEQTSLAGTCHQKVFRNMVAIERETLFMTFLALIPFALSQMSSGFGKWGSKANNSTTSKSITNFPSVGLIKAFIMELCLANQNN